LLSKNVFSALALGDLGLQLIVGSGEFGGTLLYSEFQFVVRSL
jgi:hypothetical protein